MRHWKIKQFAKLDRDIVNQATKPTQSNVLFPIITEHDVFLHMTRFLHISLFAVTCLRATHSKKVLNGVQYIILQILQLHLRPSI